MNRHFQKKSGFTVIELLIALGLFTTLVTIAVGGFVNVLRTQRQVTGLLAANTNVSFVLEQMAREMRTGRSFYCSSTGVNNPCPHSTTDVVFTNSNDEVVEYSYEAGTKSIRRSVGGGPSDLITSQTVSVEYFTMVVANNPIQPADDYPTRVTIMVGVASKQPGPATNVIHLQTSVSARFDG